MSYLDQPEYVEKCPKCGLKDVSVFNYNHICQQCGYEWEHEVYEEKWWDYKSDNYEDC